MACYHPIQGWRAKKLNENGKRSIVFKRNAGYVDMPVEVPCGQCIGCRLEKSRQWAMRCVHEAQLYKFNCFLTLTYNNENLPEGKSLVKEDLQKFLKRLRKKYGKGIKFYACGEYGPKLSRPHYHLCVFNFDFKDKEIWKVKDGFRLYRSSSLESLWPYGYSLIGDVTFESAAYVARYVTKKIIGKEMIDYYDTIDSKTGEILEEKLPEFATMSRRPGIGAKWLDKYSEDIYNYDYVIVNGKKCRPPKYYDNRFEIEKPDDYAKIKGRRKRNRLISEKKGETLPNRVSAKEIVQSRKFNLLRRGYEENLCGS